MSLEDTKEVKSHDKENHSDTNTIKEKELEDQEGSKNADQTNTATETTKETAEKERTKAETQAEAETEAKAADTTWTAVWDANAQAYYWWNTATNETTWNNPEGYEYNYDSSSVVPQSDNPLDSILNTIETRLKKELDGDSNNVDNTVPYSNYFEDSTATATQDTYSLQAHFNSRTGRFTTQEDAMRLNPENFTIENRATKQMSYYFDVDNYTEEYNRRRHQESGKKKPLSRKQVDYFKKMKKEKKQKKAREWLLQ